MTRRALLAGAVWGLDALRADAPDGRKLRIMVTGGHPGDPEYGCGGTIARYADLGHDVALVYLNRGEKSCPETAADAAGNVRVAEAKRACQILKARPLFAGSATATR